MTLSLLIATLGRLIRVLCIRKCQPNLKIRFYESLERCRNHRSFGKFQIFESFSAGSNGLAIQKFVLSETS